MLVCSAGCDRQVEAVDSETDTACGREDTDGPEIAHVPITDAQPAGVDVLVEAAARDACGVFTMTMFYRQESADVWKQYAMMAVGEGSAEDDGAPWMKLQGAIRSSDLGPDGMQYWFWALDDSHNANESCLGEVTSADLADCGERPLRFTVEP